VPITLMEADAKQISAVLKIAYQPCSTPTLGVTVFGTVSQRESGLVLTMRSRDRVASTNCDEVRILMSESDSKIFWQVDGEISAALQAMAAKKSTKATKRPPTTALQRR
ncbi:MAG: hypothetical protein J0653_07335, partial [Deltaproteobacteria bacterium]|nr:hypothetical protein [Deltaproteobacteria bacterium]